MNAVSSTELEAEVRRMGETARSASRQLAASSSDARNTALLAAADAIQACRVALADANAKDLQRAESRNLDAALIDRLALNSGRIDAMIEGLHQVAALPDPVGAVRDVRTQRSGLRIGKMRVPLGVVGIIYESRPNVTADAASLCLKSANATILRGGSEALHSNSVIASAMRDGAMRAGFEASVVQLIETRDRAAVAALLRMDDCIDVVIPRGGKGLIERIVNDSRVPVIKHLDGICHVYIDSGADHEMAVDITVNAKTQRYGTCNTAESLLVHAQEAPALLPRIAEALRSAGVELRACERAREFVSDAIPAIEADWSTEYLAPILSIAVVDDVAQAITHINRYGSGHTDAIVTRDLARSEQFLRAVDSSSVIVNASTRFADGFEYGLGAEIGISTDKLHARGPVGLEGLTSEKYIVHGEGQVRR